MLAQMAAISQATLDFEWQTRIRPVLDMTTCQVLVQDLLSRYTADNTKVQTLPRY